MRTIYDIPTPTTPIERVFQLQNNVIISAINPYRGRVPQGNPADLPVATSSLGTPVYSDFTFDAGTYTDDANNTIEIAEINFQTVIITVEQAKNIVVTSISGANGTVKEYIGMGDYRITIQGVITGTNGSYPQPEVNALINVLSAPIALNVTSYFLAQFGIVTAVVTDYLIPQIEGSNSIQPFNIVLLSDRSNEAILL